MNVNKNIFAEKTHSRNAFLFDLVNKSGNTIVFRVNRNSKKFFSVKWSYSVILLVL